MPDLDNILFSAEYDNTAFAQGVTENINNLRALSAEQLKLQAAMDGTQKKLNDVQTQLLNTNRQIADLDKSSKNYTTTNQTLTTQASNLSKQAAVLQDQLKNQKQQLDQVSQSSINATKTLQQLATTQLDIANNAKQPISPVFDGSAALNTLAQIKSGVLNTLQGFDFSGFEGLQEKLLASKDEIEQLGTVIEFAKEQVKEFKPETTEWEKLNELIEVGQTFLSNYNAGLGNFGKALDTTGEKTESLRTRIMNLRKELTSLEDSGKEETQQYKDVQLAAASLTEQYQRQQQQIHILASNTKELDFGLAAINTAAVGYQTMVGLTELLGVKNETLDESEKKLLAVLNLVAGAQRLQELLLKENTLLTIGADYATRAYTAVNNFLAISFGEAATAATIFKGVLITTGVGALVIGLGYLIYSLSQANDEEKKITDTTNDWGDAIEGAKDKVAEAFKNVATLRQNVELAKDGFVDKNRVVKEYNETIGKTTGAVKSLDQVETFLAQHADAYIQFTLLKAAANIALGKAAEEAFNIESANFNIGQNQNKIQESNAKSLLSRVQLAEQGLGKQADVLKQYNETIGKSAGQVNTLAEAEKKLNDIIAKQPAQPVTGINQLGITIGEKQAEEAKTAEDKLVDISNQLLDKAKELAKQNHWDLLEGQFEPDKGRQLENVYEAQLKSLSDKLRALAQSNVTTYDTIRKEVHTTIQETSTELDNFYKKGQLTQPQLQDLRRILGLVEDATLKKEFADYDKARNDAQKAIDEDLLKVQQDESKKRVENITDEFKRSFEEINIEYQTSKTNLVSQKEAAIKQANEDFAEGLFGDPKSPEAIQKLTEITFQYEGLFNRLFDDLDIFINQKKQDLAAKAFQTGLESLQLIADSQINDIQISADKEITALNNLYTAGKINYKDYQKQLTQINEAETNLRLLKEKQALQAQSASISIRTTVSGISDKEIDDLKAQYDKIQKAIADINVQISDNNAKGHKQDEDDNTAHLQKEIAAYGSFVQTILGFLNQLDEAESQRIERQISFQQKRLDFAKQIADKGNADYLEIEQKRYDELQRMQEEHAAKQQAINNAIVLSQSIVAAVSAIASAAQAPPPLDIALIAAAAAAVFGAIGAAFKFAQSLNVPVQSFYEGTEFVQLNGNKPGRDTVPAMVNEGERIVDHKTNKEYNNVLHAIHTKGIPAPVLNSFVSNYQVAKIPKTDYSRLGKATEHYLVSNANELANHKLGLIHQQLLTMNDNFENLEPVNLDMKMDKDGFAFSLLSAVRQLKLRKRS